jgi:serine protease AprX
MMRPAAAFVFALLLTFFASGASAAPFTDGSGAPPAGPQAPDGPPPALADRDNNGISDDFQAKLATAQASDRFDVIVSFDGPGNAASARATVGAFELHHTFGVLNGFSATMTAGQAQGLANTPGVFRIEENFTVQAMLDGATDNYGVNDAWPLLGGAAFAGLNVDICIVDTGANPLHDQLDGGKIVGFFDAINGLPNAYDDHSISPGFGGHGTHVASIAAGGGGFSGARYIQGVAPAANLYIAKGLSSAGSATDEQVIRAMEWCSEQAAVDIISMSLGTLLASDGKDSLSLVTNCIVDPAGSPNCVVNFPSGNVDTGDSDPKIVVIANGNSGPGELTVGAPAAAAKSIAVGALSNWEDTRLGGQYLISFSSRGPNLANPPVMKPDISAPGAYIFAADSLTTNGYFSISGTSMATPFIAGVVALMLDADSSLGVDDGTLPQEKVRTILANTARDFGAPGADNEYGAGAVDAFLAVNEALGNAGATPTPSPAYHRETAFVANGGDWFSTPFTVTNEDITTGIAMIVTIDGSPYCFWGDPVLCELLGGYEFDPDLELELIDVATNSVVPAGSTDITVSTCPAAGEWCGYHPSIGFIIPGAGRQETVHYFPSAADVGKQFQARVYSFAGAGNFDFEMWRAPLGDGGTPVDNPPTVNIMNPTGGTVSGAVMIQVDASDTEDATGSLTVEVAIGGGTWQAAAYNGVSGFYEWSWDTTVETEGAHSIDARATDSGTNSANDGPVLVTVDNIDEAPTVGIVNPTGGTVSGTVTVQVDASDTEDAAGSLNVEVAIDGGAWQSATYNAGNSLYEWSWDTTLLADGNHSVVAQATDSAPNTVGDGPVPVTVNNTDVAPAVNIASPTGGTVSGAVTIQVNANDTEDPAGSLTVDVAIDGGAWQSTTYNPGNSLYEWSWDTTVETDGPHDIDARVTDSGTNTVFDGPVSVTVDNIDANPTVSVTSPTASATVSGVETVQVTANDAEDAVGTLNVQVAIDGGAWQSATYNGASGFYEWAWDTTLLADGTHSVVAQATDSGTNTVGDGPVSVTVSNTAVNNPPIARDDNVAMPNGREMTIAVLANDEDPDGHAISVVSVGAAVSGAVTLNPDDTVTYRRDRTFRNGCDSFGYTIEDSQGEPASATVRVAVGSGTCGGGGDIAPSASIASPTGGSISGNVTIEVDASDTEDAAGTLNVEVQIDGGTWQSATYNGGSGLYEWVWDTAMATDGSHTIDARATDSATNTTNAGQVTVTVNNGGSGSDVMFVGDVAFSQKDYGPGKSNHDLTTVVTIQWDSNGNGIADGTDSPAAQATVTVELCHQGGQCWDWTPLSTSGAGTANFILKRAPVGGYTFSVNGLTHGTYLWETSLDQGNPSFHTLQ